MEIALTYNLKEKDETKPADYFSEYDSPETISAITGALHKSGHNVRQINTVGADLFSLLRQNRVDMVFNIAEGRGGKLRESEVPAVLDYLNIPYTGSPTFSLALALNKALTKKILKAENIPTPDFQVFSSGNEKLKAHLKFPLMVKPNREGSGKGIGVSSVVYNPADLFCRVNEIIHKYRQEALVEEFIDGRELTVGILEGAKTTILPVLEIDFSSCRESGEYFYSWRMKEFQGSKELSLTPTFHCPAPLDKETERKVKELALRTHHAVGCLDISRTDIRLDANHTPYVLEINPLPGLNPTQSNFPLMAYAAGMTYDELVNAILMNAALRRRGLN